MPLNTKSFHFFEKMEIVDLFLKCLCNATTINFLIIFIGTFLDLYDSHVFFHLSLYADFLIIIRQCKEKFIKIDYFCPH